MSVNFPFYIYDSIAAAQLRALTEGEDAQINPIQIRGGTHKGDWAVRAQVADDPAFADHKDAIQMGKLVSLVPTVAFPPEPEEE